MTRRKQSKGDCLFCGRKMTRGGLSRHLAACPQRKEAILKADSGPEKKQTLYHLLIKDAWEGEYWLHAEMPGTATLGELDDYLRGIWLECCGHLSMFSVGGWRGEEISMQRRIAPVFRNGDELTHIYDFGTSSKTSIKMVGKRIGKPLTKHPLYLMARNDPPVIECVECDKPAKWLCYECIHEWGEFGALCDEHAKTHPHDEYGGPQLIVNSPRIGMCGYSGPAEPPY